MRFLVEWLEAPGVTDVVDAASWARMTIKTRDEQHCFTEAVDLKNLQRRTGVYGPVYPLVRWFVDNWWFLTSEGPRTPKMKSGRKLAALVGLGDWVHRHNLLSARHGFSLPDLSIMNDGGAILLVCRADPPGYALRPVRFTSETVAVSTEGDLRAGVSELVTAFLERTRDIEHDDVSAIRKDWAAIEESERSEQQICWLLAKAGLDAYDLSEATDEVVQYFEENVQPISKHLRNDLLDATMGGPDVCGGVSWINDSASDLTRSTTMFAESRAPKPTAFETGYQRARSVRREIGAKPTEPAVVPSLAKAKFGFGFGQFRDAGESPGFIDGMVGGLGRECDPVIVGVDLPHEDMAFRWARALYFFRFGLTKGGPRLLTRSHSRNQRESRAFAAELLAPASAIRRMVTKPVIDASGIAAMAAEFSVRPRVIEHQLENHGIALVD